MSSIALERSHQILLQKQVAPSSLCSTRDSVQTRLLQQHGQFALHVTPHCNQLQDNQALLGRDMIWDTAHLADWQHHVE
jgi:hypothetical protein